VTLGAADDLWRAARQSGAGERGSPLPAPGAEARLVRRERQGALMRRDDPRAGATTIALADLRNETLLLHPRDANPGHYDAVVGLCAAAGFHPRLALRTLSLDLAQTPVAAGEAIAIVGESTLAGLPPTWRGSRSHRRPRWRSRCSCATTTARRSSSACSPARP
jgi:DNA-binding transcriptional LysR family regulator